MTLGEHQEIFSENVGKLITYAVGWNLGVRLRELQRTEFQQAEYVRTGKSKTNNSLHLSCLAIDIYFTRADKIIEGKDELQSVGAYWESLHPQNKWGGNFKSFLDCPHFEMQFIK